MNRKIGELEKVSIRVTGVVKCLGDHMDRACIRTNRSAEYFLWRLAMRAGYSLGDEVEYEIRVKKKPQET
jgi:hypothetical protein